MGRCAGAARRVAVIAVAAGSIVACFVLTWHAVRPGVIGQLGNTHLLVLLGLFVSPPVALLAWRWERQHAIESPAPGLDDVEHRDIQPAEARHTHPAQRHQDEQANRQHHRRRAGTPQT